MQYGCILYISSLCVVLLLSSVLQWHCALHLKAQWVFPRQGKCDHDSTQSLHWDISTATFIVGLIQSTMQNLSLAWLSFEEACRKNHCLMPHQAHPHFEEVECSWTRGLSCTPYTKQMSVQSTTWARRPWKSIFRCIEMKTFHSRFESRQMN